MRHRANIEGLGVPCEVDCDTFEDAVLATYNEIYKQSGLGSKSLSLCIPTEFEPHWHVCFNDTILATIERI